MIAKCKYCGELSITAGMWDENNGEFAHPRCAGIRLAERILESAKREFLRNINLDAAMEGGEG